jgi:hypothetical protein
MTCESVRSEALVTGEMQLQTPSGSRTVQASSEPLRTISFPANFIIPGEYRVSASPGRDVGAFLTSLSIPEPIRLSSDLLALREVPCCTPFRVGWTGGAADAVVNVRAIVRSAALGTYFYECAVQSTVGSVSLPFGQTGSVLAPSQDVEIVITMKRSPAVTFSATGLGQTGTHRYTYQWRLLGLKTSAL